ncbi:unnamed protein product [Rhizoctonia solani]|uniref:Uncharacterized protein n=1 Tax=Rhizoctonia solani TaxID=456999 RepID=A0A8H2XRG7_9AGAM|nr:unnamed protein product [Rhizoctonia solani]
MDLSQLSQLVADASSSNLFPNESATPPLQKIDTSLPLEFKEGVALFATFDFDSARPGSLTDRLNTMANSNLSNVGVMGYFGKSGSGASTTIFASSISTLELSASIILERALLTYTPVAWPNVGETKGQTPSPGKTKNPDPDANQSAPQSGKLVNAFMLSADCLIKFPSGSSWIIPCELEITKAYAQLAATAPTGTHTLSETLGLQISKIQLACHYTFSTASDSGASAVDQVRQAPQVDIALSCQVNIGPTTALGALMFDTGLAPGVLVLFEANIPRDVLDISFSHFLLYYAWMNIACMPTRGQFTPYDGYHAIGFHAEARVSIYGIEFSIALHITGGGGSGDKRGIKLTGTKTTPVKFLVLALHGELDESQGPSLILSIEMAEGSCSSETARFRGTVLIQAKFIPGGSASIIIEVLEIGPGKYVLRFMGLPIVFPDLIKVQDIIKTIEMLSQIDGSPCGLVKLAFDELKTELHIKVSMSEFQIDGSLDQNEDHPQDTSIGTFTLQLIIDGYYDITAVGKSVREIRFDPLPISIKIPKSITLDAFASALQDSLAGAAEE